MNNINNSEYRKPESISSDDSSSDSNKFVQTSELDIPLKLIKMDALAEAIKNMHDQILDLSSKIAELETRRSHRSTEEDELNEHSTFLDRTGETQMSQSVKNLKSYLELITEFEGSNISVETFIFEVKSVLEEILPEDKRRFIRLVIAKRIIKQARKSIDGYEIRSAEDLFHTLRSHFGEKKSFDVATLERSQCHQGNDTVLSYSKKFNEAHLNVKRAINNNPDFDANHRAVSLINEDRQGLVQYVRGLRPNTKLFVKASNPKSIREAQNLALETEKEEMASRTMYKSLNNNKSRSTLRNGSSQNSASTSSGATSGNSTSMKRIFPCHGCGETGHFIRSCPKKQNQNFPSRSYQNKPPDQMKYTECQGIKETQEQASSSEWIVQ